MKNCEAYAPALSAFVDGELDEAERADVLAHLEACEGCREYLAELSAMHAAFESMTEYDAPEGFADGVMARLHEAAPKKRTRRIAWASLAACAAIILFAVGGPLRGSQDTAEVIADDAQPRTMMAAVAESAPCEPVEEEYMQESYSVQNAQSTMITGAEPEERAVAAEAEKSAADTAAELPRSVVFVHGAAHEDYLVESATDFDYYADGTTAGYDLPMEMLGEFLALLEADGLTYESSVLQQALTFYVQYEEENANG